MRAGPNQTPSTLQKTEACRWNVIFLRARTREAFDLSPGTQGVRDIGTLPP